MKYLVLMLAALLQLGVVAWMIGGREWVLANGREVKFVTRPADPADPFRGRYVALRFEADTYETDAAPGITEYRPVYAILFVDEEGYASVTGLSATQPATDVTYVKADKCWTLFAHTSRALPKDATGEPAPEEKRPVQYRLEFPFDRYYMNEKAAPEAERRYREANRASAAEDEPAMTRDNYLTVRLLKGRAVADQLYLQGRPVERLLDDGK